MGLSVTNTLCPTEMLVSQHGQLEYLFTSILIVIMKILDALEAIQTRNSAARLRGSVEPGHLEQILKAGFRAPDHALLRPWRILVIEGEARDRLGALFAQAKLTP